MKTIRFTRLILFITIGIFSQTCSLFDDNTNNSVSTKITNEEIAAIIPKTEITTTITGYVVDEGNVAIENATVTSGTITVTSDKNGFFDLGEGKYNKNHTYISVSKAGYFNASRTINPTEKSVNIANIMMYTKNETAKVSAIIDNKIEVTKTVSIQIPKNCVMTKDSTPYTGEVKVFAKYLDPKGSTFFDIMPGNLTGINDNKAVTGLESFGMINVELTDDNGASLIIDPSKEVTLEMPSAGCTDATIPLWYFDTKNGIWIEEGKATLTNGKYVGSVKHFTVWNLDKEMNGYKLSLKLVNSQNQPLASTKFKVKADNDYIYNYYYTDNNGCAELINFPTNKTLSIETNFECGTITKIIGIVKTNKSDTIVYEDEIFNGLRKVEIYGTLSNSLNLPIPAKQFSFYIQGKQVFVETKSDGSYTVNAYLCLNKVYEGLVYLKNNGTLLTKNITISATDVKLKLDIALDGGQIINSDGYFWFLTDKKTYGLGNYSINDTANVKAVYWHSRYNNGDSTSIILYNKIGGLVFNINFQDRNRMDTARFYSYDNNSSISGKLVFSILDTNSICKGKIIDGYRYNNQPYSQEKILDGEFRLKIVKRK